MLRPVLLALALLALCACAGAPRGQSALADQNAAALRAYQEGRLADAERLYLALTESHPGFAEAWFRLGNLYVRTGQLAAAVRAFESCLKDSPEQTRAWHNLALVRVKQALAVLDEGEARLAQEPAQAEHLALFRARLLASLRAGDEAGGVGSRP